MVVNEDNLGYRKLSMILSTSSNKFLYTVNNKTKPPFTFLQALFIVDGHNDVPSNLSVNTESLNND